MISSSINENDIEVELEELNQLSQAILTKYGYDFTNYAQSSFKRRIIMVLKKNSIKSVGLLIQKIVQDPKFFEQFVTDITVNTTELFRDPSFFRVVREELLPILSNRPEFNIWHAACSTGEEVISMAILLKEEGLWEKAKIYATDINTAVLKKAAEARYPLRNWELFKQNYSNTNPKGKLEDYCEIKDNEIQFDKDLIKNVRFKQHDLAVDQHFFKFDFILCRNVMIYFNQKLQNRVFELLHNSLFLGGYLALGAKESLIWCKIADKFAAFNENEKIYKKIKL
ncbi:MAG: protein-glutamate O-methyltransferase CheR [Bacteroidia bacterium]|nr:protein-glutamate O-methyltransferase CheR [Bacteroidia bacterium]MDW8159387.1 protein-glutamate O-methyltransferase CheR [Bacteroidia bacterium]